MLTQARGGGGGGVLRGKWTHLHCSDWDEEEEKKGGRGGSEAEGSTNSSLWAKIRSFPQHRSIKRAQCGWCTDLRNVFYGACLFVEVCAEVKGCGGDERNEPAEARWYFSSLLSSSISLPGVRGGKQLSTNTHKYLVTVLMSIFQVSALQLSVYFSDSFIIRVRNDNTKKRFRKNGKDARKWKW